MTSWFTGKAKKVSGAVATAMCALFASCAQLQPSRHAVLQAGAPSIELISVPGYGEKGMLKAKITNAAPGMKAAVYIYNNGWSNKPYWEPALSEIKPGGLLECDIATKGGDEFAVKIAVFVVPGDFKAPLIEGAAVLPEILARQAAASAIYQRHIIDFAGKKWMYSSSDDLMGPGPNYFTKHPNDIFTDAQGRLHLRITKREGKWYSSAVVLMDRCGYGKYVFYVDGRFDLLDKNTVVGLFTWDNNAPQANYREIDIEFSRWGSDTFDNTQFVIQPFKDEGNAKRFDIKMEGKETSVHYFDWRPEKISFLSAYGENYKTPAKADIICKWEYSGKDLPETGAEKLIINFWQMDGKPPSDGRDAEVIIRDFKFIPAK